MTILLIDGIRYKLWTPKDEEKEFHPLVRKYSKEIFGNNTVYLDISPRLKSEAGIGSKPDGFVIDPINARLYIVEVELSKHDPYKHINDQLTRFINGLDNLATKNMVVEALFDEIDTDRTLKWFFEEKVKENLHKWLSKLLSKSPIIAVVIEEKTQKVLEACKILMKSYDTKIVEFKTYQREDAPTVHAQLFEPLNVAEKAAAGIFGADQIESKAERIVSGEVKDLFLKSIDELRQMNCSIKPLQGRWLSVWINGKRFMYMAARKNWFICQIEKKKGEWTDSIRVKAEEDWKNVVQTYIRPVIENPQISIT
jgi:hypothetical protein